MQVIFLPKTNTSALRGERRNLTDEMPWSLLPLACFANHLFIYLLKLCQHFLSLKQFPALLLLKTGDFCPPLSPHDRSFSSAWIFATSATNTRDLIQHSLTDSAESVEGRKSGIIRGSNHRQRDNKVAQSANSSGYCPIFN